jgi:predicted kinase
LPESAYSPAASDAVFAELTALANGAAAGGHAVIADGMFLNPEQRASIAQAASRAGVAFLGLWLTAPRDVLEARLASRTGDASDATVAVLQAVVRNDRGGGDWLAIDATDAAAALAQVQQLAEVQQAVQTRFGSHVRQQTC